MYYYEQVINGIVNTLRTNIPEAEVVKEPPQVRKFKDFLISVLFDEDTLNRGEIPEGTMIIRVVVMKERQYEDYDGWLRLIDDILNVLHSNWDEGLDFVKGKYVTRVTSDLGVLHPKIAVVYVLRVDYFREGRTF